MLVRGILSLYLVSRIVILLEKSFFKLFESSHLLVDSLGVPVAGNEAPGREIGT